MISANMKENTNNSQNVQSKRKMKAFYVNVWKKKMWTEDDGVND